MTGYEDVGIDDSAEDVGVGAERPNYGWLRIYYRIYGVRSVRLTNAHAFSLKGQLQDAAANGMDDDTVLSIGEGAESFSVRAADIAAMVFIPSDVASPRYDTFKRWWFDLESGGRLRGIASDTDWDTFEKAACASSKDGQILSLKAGSHDVYVIADTLSSWRSVPGHFGAGFDYEDDESSGQNYRNNDRHGGGHRGGGRNDRQYGRSHGGGRSYGDRRERVRDGGGGGWSNR